MENARRCMVAVEARGTKSRPKTEERKARRPDTLDSLPNYRARRGMRGVVPRRHLQTKTTIL